MTSLTPHENQDGLEWQTTLKDEGVRGEFPTLENWNEPSKDDAYAILSLSVPISREKDREEPIALVLLQTKWQPQGGKVFERFIHSASRYDPSIVNQEWTDRNGRKIPLLHQAIRCNRPEAVRTLLALGANPNTLYQPAKGGPLTCLELVQELRKKGVKHTELDTIAKLLEPPQVPEGHEVPHQHEAPPQDASHAVQTAREGLRSRLRRNGIVLLKQSLGGAVNAVSKAHRIAVEHLPIIPSRVQPRNRVTDERVQDLGKRMFSGGKFSPTVLRQVLLHYELSWQQFARLQGPPPLNMPVIFHCLAPHCRHELELVLDRFPQAARMDHGGQTPLSHAIYPFANLRAVELLIAHGADVTTTDVRKNYERLKQSTSVSMASDLGIRFPTLQHRIRRIGELLQPGQEGGGKKEKTKAWTMKDFVTWREHTARLGSDKPDFSAITQALTSEHLTPRLFEHMRDLTGTHIAFLALDHWDDPAARTVAQKLFQPSWWEMTLRQQRGGGSKLPPPLHPATTLNPWGYALLHGNAEAIEWVYGQVSSEDALLEYCGLGTQLEQGGSRAAQLRTGTLLSALIDARRPERSLLERIFVQLPRFRTQREQITLNRLVIQHYRDQGVTLVESPEQLVQKGFDPFILYRTRQHSFPATRDERRVALLQTAAYHVVNQGEPWINLQNAPQPWKEDMLEEIVLASPSPMDAILKNPAMRKLTVYQNVLDFIAQHALSGELKAWDIYESLCIQKDLMPNGFPLPTRQQVEAMGELFTVSRLAATKVSPSDIARALGKTENAEDAIIELVRFTRSGFPIFKDAFGIFWGPRRDTSSFPFGSRGWTILGEAIRAHSPSAIRVILENHAEHLVRTDRLDGEWWFNDSDRLSTKEHRSLQPWHIEERAVIDEVRKMVRVYRGKGQIPPPEPIRLTPKDIAETSGGQLKELFLHEMQKTGSDDLNTFYSWWTVMEAYPDKRKQVFDKDTIDQLYTVEMDEENKPIGKTNVLERIVGDCSDGKASIPLKTLRGILTANPGIIDTLWHDEYSLLGTAVITLQPTIVKVLITEFGAIPTTLQQGCEDYQGAEAFLEGCRNELTEIADQKVMDQITKMILDPSND